MDLSVWRTSQNVGKSPVIYVAAAGGGKKENPQQVIDRSIEDLSSPDRDVRMSAMFDIQRTAYQAAPGQHDKLIRALLSALSDEDSTIRSVAAETLCSMAVWPKNKITPARRQHIFDSVLALQQSANVKERRGAANFYYQLAYDLYVLKVGDVQPPRSLVIDGIMNALKDPDNDVFVKAYLAVREAKLSGDLLARYKEIVPALVSAIDRQVEEVNYWNGWWKEDYMRPKYEAAALIGMIAKEARKTNDQEAVNFIRTASLDKISGLLSFENPRPGVDYGIVYVIYPLRLAVLQALADIGDASVIPAIEKCGTIDYRSPYNDRFCSVAEAKKTAIEYLRAQAASSDFIEPPKIWG